MLKEEALPPPVMCGKTLPTHNPKVITNRSPQSTNSVISTYSFLRKISNESGFVQQLCNMAVNKSAVEIANEFTSFHTTLQKLDAKIIKRELLANFAYPLFCHTYVTCLGKNEQIAGEFWAKYSDKLKNQTGVPCSICDKLTNFKFLQQSSVQDQASLISELNALANVKIVRTISEQASEQLTKVLATNDFQFISSLFLNKLQVNISNVETEILQTSSPDGFEIEQFLQSPFETDETKVKIEPSCENDLGESATKSEEQTITDGERSHTYVATHLLSTNFTNVLCSDLSGNYLATGNLDNAIRTIDLVHSQMQNIHPIPLESISLQNFANSLPEDEELEQIFAENRKRIDKLKSLNVLYGHHKPVFSLKFSNTWPYLLSCGGDGDCRLWDLTTNKSVVNYSGHNFSLYAVSVSNNDSYFASGGQDMTCRVWSFENSISPVRILCRHEATVNSLDFHPNGKFILSGGSDCLCVMWDVEKAEHVRIFTEQKSQVSAVKFAPNGQFVAVGSKSGDVMLYDIRSSKLLWKSESKWRESEEGLFTNAVKCIEFSEDSKQLYTAGMCNSISFWDCDNGKLECDVTNEEASVIVCLKKQDNNLLSCVALKS